MAKKQIVETPEAPSALGPYSQAIIANGFCFVSGQLGMDPSTGDLNGDVQEQTRQALDNMGAILAASGLSHDDVVKCSVFMADISQFGQMNEIYAEFFGSGLPARSAFEVAKLPKGALVEIEAIAALNV